MIKTRLGLYAPISLCYLCLFGVVLFQTQPIWAAENNLQAGSKLDTSGRVITSSREALIEYIKLVSPRYNIPPLLMLAIAETEARAVSKPKPWTLNIAGQAYYPETKEEAMDLIARTDAKSYDIGIMQINSFWLRKFGIRPEDAIEPAVNIRLAAYILNENFVAHGVSWRAISAYHVGTLRVKLESDDAARNRKARADRYAKTVWKHYSRLMAAEQKTK